MATTDTRKFVVKRAVFQYNKMADQFDWAKGEVVQVATVQYAFRGDVVTNLDGRDITRGLHYEEIEELTEETAVPAGVNPETGESTDKYANLSAEEFQAYTTDQIVQFMIEAEPSVERLTELAGSSPAAASRVIAAEDRVTDEDPRTDLVGSMQDVIRTEGSDEGSDDESETDDVEDDAEGGGDADDEEEEEDYSSWKVDDLKAELDEREVEYDAKAKKADLVKLLVDDDDDEE